MFHNRYYFLKSGVFKVLFEKAVGFLVRKAVGILPILLPPPNVSNFLVKFLPKPREKFAERHEHREQRIIKEWVSKFRDFIRIHYILSPV